MVVWILLAQLATQGARPAECGAAGASAANVWERAKSPELRSYCDLLASGASKLASARASPRDVLAIADAADRKLPGRLAPAVLRGRALERLGRFDEAYSALAAVRAKDSAMLEDAPALLAFARAAVRSAHLAEAGQAYVALLPRASALPAADRGPAYVEAGFAVMARGASGIDEAVAVFRQARKDAQDAAQTLAWLGLALALDRAGSREEARAVLGERSKFDARGALADARSRDLLAAPFAAEGDALLALSLEQVDAAAAREAYKRYADAGGAWADHARAAAAALGGRRR